MVPTTKSLPITICRECNSNELDFWKLYPYRLKAYTGIFSDTDFLNSPSLDLQGTELCFGIFQKIQ